MNFHFGFSFAGLLIFLAPMLINILYVLWPPSQPQTDRKQPVWDEIEGATRLLYALALCLLVPAQPLNFGSVFFYGMVFFLVMYYVVWARYFAGGRDVRLLGTSFLFVPMPLAVFPVLYFLCGALWLKNVPAALFMVVFGFAHNLVSYRNLYSAKDDRNKAE